MDWVCDGNQAGTTGQGRQLQSLRIKAWGEGSICAMAYVGADYNQWENQRCGVEGQVFQSGMTGRPIFGLFLFAMNNAGGICFRPHVAFYGWRTNRCDTTTPTAPNRGVYWVHSEDPPMCNGSWLGGCVPLPPTNDLEAITIWRY